MNNKSELQKLVISNLAILEAAPVVVSEVEHHIFEVIDTKIEKWVQRQGDWEGIFDFLGSETSIKPMAWEKTSDGTYTACFSLACESAEGYNHYLSPLLGVVPKKFGFWFGVDAKRITGLGGKGSQPGKEWKLYLSDKFEELGLGAFGFDLCGQSLLLPLVIASEVLTSDYPDSINDALAPVDDALEALCKAIPILTELLAEASTKFNREVG